MDNEQTESSYLLRHFEKRELEKQRLAQLKREELKEPFDEPSRGNELPDRFFFGQGRFYAWRII